MGDPNLNSVRSKSVVFKFKVWSQKRSQNLSCNPAQILLRTLPISGVLEGQMTWNLVGGRKRQFSTTFMKKIFSNSDGNNDILSRQELEVYPPRLPTALLGILAISRALVIQILCNFMGEKIRWLPITFMKNTLPNLEWINVISSSQSAWVLLSIKSTKSIVGHYINNQLPNE